MNLRLIAVGTRMPDWVNAGYAEYARRLPRETPLELLEIPSARRRGLDLERARNEESARMLAKVTPTDWVVVLDEHGKQLDTAQLSARMASWRMQGRDVVFLVGGADGLGAECRARADETVALSRLTLPHGMVRVVLAEQLYRAWTLLSSHPYHRA